MEEKESLAALLGAFPIRLKPVWLQGVRTHVLGDRLQLPEQVISDLRLDFRLVEELERLHGQVVQFDALVRRFCRRRDEKADLLPVSEDPEYWRAVCAKPKRVGCLDRDVR